MYMSPGLIKFYATFYDTKFFYKISKIKDIRNCSSYYACMQFQWLLSFHSMGSTQHSSLSIIKVIKRMISGKYNVFIG